MTRGPTGPYDPSEAQTWEALARFLSGESSAAESRAIREWLESEPADAQLIGALDRSMRALSAKPLRDLDVDGALQSIRGRLHVGDGLDQPPEQAEPARERKLPIWRTNSFRIAAAVALLLGALAVWRTSSGPDTGPMAPALAFATAVGRVDSIPLADGTRVILGPDSRLAIDAGYGSGARTVVLTGEAMFEVVHDASSPFTVSAGDASIRDLGTRFSIRTFDATVQVAVMEGSVLFNGMAAPDDAGVVLAAGDAGTLDANGNIEVTPGSVTDADLEWTRGRLVFDEATLARVVADLRRWYGVDVRVNDTTLAGRHITATFEGEQVEQVLNAIALTLGARTVQRGDTVFLEPGSAR